jgi:hypothetical protein
MLNLTSLITITQQPTSDFPSRSKVFTFDFVTEGEVSSTWQNLTDTARLVFPKNIYFKDETGNNYSWEGKNVIGDSNTPPLILRGDKVEIVWGYYYNVDENYNYTTQSNTIFKGFVSKVTNRIPIEIECEDNMWKLKGIAAPNKVYKGSEYSLQSMLQELLKGTDFTVNSDAKTSLGDFRTLNETVAQVLDRLQREYRIESYFRENELRCSGIVYYPDYVEKVFQFQQNIISDDLEYRRTDDISIGIKAYSVNELDIGPKKKKKRLQTFVTNKGITDEAGFEGEKRTLYFWDVKSEADLAAKAQSRLKRLFYEGYFGSFETFGFPFVRHGDHAIMRDDVIPERNGTYKIKAVTYRFGTSSGYRQDVEVDLRVDGLYTQTELNEGL